MEGGGGFRGKNLGIQILDLYLMFWTGDKNSLDYLQKKNGDGLHVFHKIFPPPPPPPPPNGQHWKSCSEDSVRLKWKSISFSRILWILIRNSRKTIQNLAKFLNSSRFWINKGFAGKCYKNCHFLPWRSWSFLLSNSMLFIRVCGYFSEIA